MKQNQQQGRRLKPLMAAEHHHHRHQQQQQQQHTPQKCPRCESLNTKFCYYNNYSLSQPRYFCKACRRYWTQGGTLRNVPVGGGCRKGKRPKLSSSGDDDNPTRQSTQRNLISPPVQLQAKESDSLVSSSAAMGSYYPASGFLSSLAAIQPMNQPQCLKQPLNQALRIGGGDFGSSSSNLGLLQGYGVPFLGSQHHQQTQFQWPAAGNSYYQQNWHQNFINEAVTSTVKVTNTSNSKTASSLSPNQWPDLPAYGAP